MQREVLERVVSQAGGCDASRRAGYYEYWYSYSCTGTALVPVHNTTVRLLLRDLRRGALLAVGLCERVRVSCTTTVLPRGAVAYLYVLSHMRKQCRRLAVEQR
jgi:hypothetical protein